MQLMLIAVHNSINACDLGVVTGELNDFNGIAKFVGRWVIPALVDAWNDIVAAVAECVQLEYDQMESCELKRLLARLYDTYQEVAILR